MLVGSLLVLLGAAWKLTRIDRTALFWSAFVLTRPFGATMGDVLTKPIEHGGLALGTFGASAVLLGLLVLAVWLPTLQRRRHRFQS